MRHNVGLGRGKGNTLTENIIRAATGEGWFLRGKSNNYPKKEKGFWGGRNKNKQVFISRDIALLYMN